jgi:hypothetical protein
MGGISAAAVFFWPYGLIALGVVFCLLVVIVLAEAEYENQ